MKYIENGSEDTNYLLFNYSFKFKQPGDLAKKVFEIKDKKKNNDFVEKINIRWSKLKDRTENMSKDEKENEELNKILEIVKDILNFNKKKTIRRRFKNTKTKPNA